MREEVLQNIQGIEQLDKKYVSRCIRELKKWNAPLGGWKCTRVEDICEDEKEGILTRCEVCGCDKVRYVHCMEHKDYFDEVKVGCICAGIMEGNILRAKERDRLLKNRSKRRKNYMKKSFEEMIPGTFYRKYKQEELYIRRTPSGFQVCVGASVRENYKGRPITNMLSAMYAAFDLVDSLEVMVQ